MSSFDVAIVGGGVIGASIAFELSAEKLRAVILDREEPGNGASSAAAGMLSPGPDSPEALPLVPLAKESFHLYPEFIAAIEEASGSHTHFTREGTLEIFCSPEGEAECDRMIAAHSKLGIGIEPISLDAASKLEPTLGPAATAAAWLPDEATVDPRLLMHSILAAIRGRDVEIRSGCCVTSLLRDGNKCVGVVAGGERIAAKIVVMAAGCHCATIGDENAADNHWFARCAPTRPIRGQMIALKPAATPLRRVLRSQRGYVVPRRDGRIVAGSTLENAGFEKRVTLEGMRKIIDAALELVPSFAGAEISETWSGLRPGTPDNLPILGPTDVEGLIIATGHYRNGILLAPVTAKLVRDWILQRGTANNLEIFSPLRFASQKISAAANRTAAFS